MSAQFANCALHLAPSGSVSPFRTSREFCQGARPRWPQSLGKTARMASIGRNDLRVLVYAPFGKDAVLIERVLAQSSVAICTLSTARELEDEISENAGAAIITEEVLQNGTI